jgi:hypothetical protein
MKILTVSRRVLVCTAAILLIGLHPASSDVTSSNPAQRVSLYEEVVGAPEGKHFVGTVVWRTIKRENGAGKSDIAVRADILIPDRNFGVTIMFERLLSEGGHNNHFFEVAFTLPPDFDGGGIANVMGFLMKPEEEVRGQPLKGRAKKLQDASFTISLADEDPERATNLELITENGWLDLPFIYGDQRKAILVIEKGKPGAAAFEEAFSVWNAEPSHSAPLLESGANR